jgi:N-acetylglucosamine-6-phosphate deacetylase
MSSTAKVVLATEIFDGDKTRRDHGLVVQDGSVAALLPRSDLPGNAEIVDFGDVLIAPGLVDLQVNGGGGVLFNSDPTVEAIETICGAHARNGTTSLLVTLITADKATTDAAIAAGLAAHEARVPGFAGLHLEGPHLSVEKKGAHSASLVRPMTATDRATLLAAAAQLPALMVTIAPESTTTDDCAALSAAGAVVSLGHSNGTAAEVNAAADAGATCVTHLFNAMSGLHHREPGLVGVALERGDLSVGLIPDGIHVHRAAVRIAVAAKRGPGHIFLVTDAMPTVGTDLDSFTLDGRLIWRQDGALRLEDGTLAGTDIDMTAAVRFMVEEIGVQRDEALRMASAYPAAVIGAAPQRGRLIAGSRADFICLSSDLTLTATWIGGRPVEGQR